MKRLLAGGALLLASTIVAWAQSADIQCPGGGSSTSCTTMSPDLGDMQGLGTGSGGAGYGNSSGSPILDNSGGVDTGATQRGSSGSALNGIDGNVTSTLPNAGTGSSTSTQGGGAMPPLTVPNDPLNNGGLNAGGSSGSGLPRAGATQGNPGLTGGAASSGGGSSVGGGGVSSPSIN